MGAPCTDTRSFLPFPEERVAAVGCAVPPPELNRVWVAQSPPDTDIHKSRPALTQCCPTAALGQDAPLLSLIVLHHLPQRPFFHRPELFQ